MKVLILGSKEYPFGASEGYDKICSGGYEVYTEDLVKRISRKVDIILVTRKFPNQKKYQKIGKIEIYRVPYINGFYLRTLSFNFFSFIKSLQLDFDVIFAMGPIATFFSVLLSVIKRKKIISAPYGIAFIQPQYNPIVKVFLKSIEIFSYKNTDMVIFTSTQEKNNFRKNFGFLPSKITIIPEAIDLNRFKFKNKKILKEFKVKGKVITFVGRLIHVKGVKYLIEALPRLKFDYTCFIVGDGPQKKELEDLTKKLKVNVIFTGFRRDIESFLSISDVFVLPSLAEGLPLSLLEAMGSKVPCIITDIPLPFSKKEVIIVPKKNPEKIAMGIEKVIHNKKLRNKLIKNAYKTINQNYSWKKVSQMYIKLFTEIVSF
ncbi:MAG: glycosyltransferase family 4 protein [Candidatus Parvarchaeota archaeon]|nr:glycosyltransferase family 4 protein [Candidatus Jingweiarchaeum tengchongense]MCW1310754.1 glycosyltransferase family 4 protein [Candidatus Jingweiarchaeum tengchongense]